MASFMCDIVTPQALVLHQEVEMVVVPGVEGEMGFLRGHAPLVSALTDGVAYVKTESGEVTYFALQGGYVEVSDEKVILLADRALASTEIIVDEAKECVASLQEKRNSLTEEEVGATTLDYDIAWCNAQLKTAEVAR